MRIYWTNHLEQGNLGLMARPKGNDWLFDEIRTLKIYETDILVSLLEQSEQAELELQNEQSICHELSIKFISFPIKDRSVPTNNQAFRTLVEELNNELEQGQKIIIHCRMGIGRTGMLAAGILMQHGYDANSAFELLSKVRTMNVPDTEEQAEWVKNTLYNKH
ncbi:MAG: dual specificity protein phosphatase family protein [Bacteroidota bacterium]